MAYKLLIADGNSSALRAAQLAFADLNFEVTSFEDGLEVLNSVHRINPDLVLLGFSLSGKDGYEIGHYLKRREKLKDIPILFLKGAFEAIDADKYAGLDCEGVIQKPNDSEKLVRTVREIIDRKKGPLTIPEDPVLEELPLPEQPPLFDLRALGKTAFSPPPLSPEIAEVVEEEVRDKVRQEVLEMERELEKRIRARMLVEMKEWAREELKSGKTRD